MTLNLGTCTAIPKKLAADRCANKGHHGVLQRLVGGIDPRRVTEEARDGLLRQLLGDCVVQEIPDIGWKSNIRWKQEKGFPVAPKAPQWQTVREGYKSNITAMWFT